MSKTTGYGVHLYLLGGPLLGVLQVTEHKFTISLARPPETPELSETTWLPVEQLSLFTDEELQMCSRGCSDPRLLVIS